MIIITHKDGIISSTNLKKVPKNFVAKHSNGSEWLFFQTEEEYEEYKLQNFDNNIDNNINIEENENPIMSALKQATPEEIEAFKNILGIK